MRKIALICIAGAALVPAACSRSGGASGQSPETQAAAVSIKGSDTMVHLVSAWAEAYMATVPGVEVSVTGGGSGTGISALLNGSTDICAASREMSAEELAAAKAQGIEAAFHTVAGDGIAVIVHPSNAVNELTLEQLKKIYTGETRDWQDAGGAPGGIILLSRESSSGTYIFFQEHVLKKQDYAPGARLMPATSAIVQAVSEDANAIGYAGLGYALAAGGAVKILRMKADDNAPAVTPSETAVKDGSYSIARALYLISGNPANSAVEPFIQFCLSAPGQRIVAENGYVPAGQ